MKFLIKVVLLLFCMIHVAWAASIVINAGHGGHDLAQNEHLMA